MFEVANMTIASMTKPAKARLRERKKRISIRVAKTAAGERLMQTGERDSRGVVKTAGQTSSAERLAGTLALPVPRSDPLGRASVPASRLTDPRFKIAPPTALGFGRIRSLLRS